MNFSRTRQKRDTRKRSSRIHCETTYQPLESRQLLASVGWDGPGQGGAELTYYVGNAPTGISQAQFESTIEDALKAWSDVVDIKFTQTNQPGLANSLDFTSRSIDGRGGTLARAYFPDDVNPSRIAGDVEFDSNDNWEVGNSQGSRAFDLLYVAVHEIGHALGINHIHSQSAVLAPSVSGNQSFQGLSQHDIDAAMELYAPAESSKPTNPTTGNDTPTTPDQPGTPTNDKPNNPSQPPSTPDDRPDNEMPDTKDPADDSDHHHPDSEHPDTDHNHPDDQPNDSEQDHDSDPFSPDEQNDDTMFPNNDFEAERRFERFINYFLRRLRFVFWSPIQFFIRW